MDAAAPLSSTRALQGVLQALTANADHSTSLATACFRTRKQPIPPSELLTNTKYNCFFPDNGIFDIILIGGGAAGSVIANRLTETKDLNVLLIEAGGDPPLESVLGGMFTYLQRSQYDWNFTYSRNDAKYHRNEVIELPQGRLLGGSNSIDHLQYIRGGPEDYNRWAAAVGDDSWGWDGMFPYLLKMEHLIDEEILASSNSKYYGTDGYITITRETSSDNLRILEAFEDIGNNYLLDINGNGTLGYSQGMFSNHFFKSGAPAYLTAMKDRSNLYVLKNTLVTKIIFEGTTAVGVEAITENDTKLTLKASKEVIVTAGVFNTPKLLMLSGVGPKEHLDSFGIDVISDLPVGQNLHDHVCTCILHKMEKSDATAQSVDVTKFPAKTTLGLRALNSSQTFADYQAINFLIPHDSETLLSICVIVFTFNNEICQTMFDSSNGRNVMMSLISVLEPEARGQVLLQSADPADPPIIELGALTIEADVESAVDSIEDYMRVFETEHFKSIDAEFVDLSLTDCEGLEVKSREYWRCYVRSMIASMFNYSSTCSMGSVVDAQLRVGGVSNLRVADSSVLPTNTFGKIKAPVIAIAEKAADIVKAEYNISS